MLSRISTLSLLVTAGSIGTTFPCGAGTLELRPEGDWFGTLNGDALRPGDEVILRAGTYSDPRKMTLGHRGSAEEPIVIRAADGERVVFRRPDSKQNSFNLVGTQHLVLQGFEITGGSAGVRISAGGGHQPENVCLIDLHIHHIGGVAVTCNHAGSRYARMVFRRNHIHHTGGHGEAFYLGCNNDRDGNTPGYIFDSIIEGNYIHDLDRPGVSQGDGIEIKDGSYGNIIRDNVIHNTKYPGIIVYGTDGKTLNTVERNVVWNTGDNGIQAAADAIVRNNIVFDSGGDAIHVRSHQRARPGNLRIVNNTVVQRTRGRTGIRVQRPRGGFTGPVVIANNAIYATRGLQLPDDKRLRLAGNAGAGSPAGDTLPITEWNPGGKLADDLDRDYQPAEGSFLLGRADPAQSPADDFSGRPRPNKTGIGAVSRRPGSPVMRIFPGFKPRPRSSP